MTRIVSAPQLIALATIGIGLLTSGCSQFIDPNVPEPIRPYVEPEFGGEYLLYRPSSYNREQTWPLIVTCHAGFADSPNQRIRAWTQLAETHGFLVVAPKLGGTRKRWSVDAAKQIPLQRDDEKHVLATVRHVRAGHNISMDRIFIHGWAAGAYAAMHIGLRHPEIFRAVSLSQPAFEEDYLAEIGSAIDPYHPVAVDYSLIDTVTGKQASRCLDWLRARYVNVTEDTSGPARLGDSRGSLAFFQEVVRNMPWIRIRAFPDRDDQPMAIQFKLTCSFEPSRYRWAFGDGNQSGLPEPIHVYETPGTYRVAVTLDQPRSSSHQRTVNLMVPEVVITTAAPAADTHP